MGEYEQVSEHESKDWVSRDFVVSEGDQLPSDADEAYLFKVILQGHDVFENEEGEIVEGEEKYLSTNLFEYLEEAEGNAEYLRRSYKGRWTQDNVIIRAYFRK